MTKIDIISGFLGAGKTTLINKLISESYVGEKLVLIENEFGEIGIDGGFLQSAGINITEMNSGCICCSLVGDFKEALGSVIEQYAPDRILIEPSGVGKLSDVIRAVKGCEADGIILNSFTVVVDVNKCKMYMKNFGEFFNDQIENAGCIIFSHTDNTSEKKLEEAVSLVREHNADVFMVTTPISELSGIALRSAMEREDSVKKELEKLMEEDVCPECGHHHHHHDECAHEHHHDHEHHHHDEECEHGNHHEHHHAHDGECDCGCGHDHHHHHHADEVFTSWGRETVKKFTCDEMEKILNSLEDERTYGYILRAKGIVESTDGKWIHFDYIPGETNIRHGSAAVTGKLCVIGSKINENMLEELFRLN